MQRLTCENLAPRLPTYVQNDVAAAGDAPGQKPLSIYVTVVHGLSMHACATWTYGGGKWDGSVS